MNDGPQLPAVGQGDDVSPAVRGVWLPWVSVVWIVAAFVLFTWAVTSPWAPFGEVPTLDQVEDAQNRVLIAGAVTVGLPATAAAVATRWRRDGQAMLLSGLALLSLLVTGLLWSWAH